MDKNLRKKVEESLKWHRRDDQCAKRLNLSLEKYKEFKKEVLQERRKKKLLQKITNIDELDIDSGFNMEKGEGRLSGLFDHEPRTPEEIIELLKIDTTKWKLSSYWNKQMADKWRVSAMVTRIKGADESFLRELIENWKPKKFTAPKPIKQDKDKPTVAGILSLQDIHFGKEGNETVDKDFEDTIKDLIGRAIGGHYLSDIFFVLGGDLINMDTFDGTTSKGTPLSNSCTATEAYIQAFDAMYWGVNYIKQFCEKLTIIYIPGNHDRLTSFHLAHALSKTITDDTIIWDVEYSERKVHKWHNNFNAFEHGDVPSKNTPLVYATKFPKEWGEATNRTLFTGHYHQERKIEYVTKGEQVGFVHKTLPSLSRTDYWHYHKKFVGNRRAGIMELQDPIKGNICELTYLIN